MSALELRGATLALAVLTLATAPNSAAAYCRLTTHQALASQCPEPCVTTGVPLGWRDEAVYTFNEGFLPGMDEASVRRIFDTSFSQWTQTDCVEGPIALRVEQNPTTTSVRDAIKDDGLSVIVHRSPEEWRQLHPGSTMAFALTIVAFDTDTGELVGADMELNGGIGTFTECPEDGCAPGASVDLANVITHEAGHFFGLAHSDVAGSTMYCDAKGWQVDKRSLELDDIEGICAAYGGFVPSAESSGCQAARGAGSAPGGLGPMLLGLLALALGVRRRRARPHPPRA